MTYKRLNSKIACYGSNKISNCFSMVSETFACSVLLLKLLAVLGRELRTSSILSTTKPHPNCYLVAILKPPTDRESRQHHLHVYCREHREAKDLGY